jgi:hypothetical protein
VAAAVAAVDGAEADADLEVEDAGVVGDAGMLAEVGMIVEAGAGADVAGAAAEGNGRGSEARRTSRE